MLAVGSPPHRALPIRVILRDLEVESVGTIRAPIGHPIPWLVAFVRGWSQAVTRPQTLHTRNTVRCEGGAGWTRINRFHGVEPSWIAGRTWLRSSAWKAEVLAGHSPDIPGRACHTKAITADVVQWLRPQPSKLMMPVRFRSSALLSPLVRALLGR